MTKNQRAKFLASRYRAAAKKSSGATIAMATTILQAERELTGGPLTKFYSAVGLDPNSSTVRKLKKIGQVSPRLRLHLARLPNAWTTLYEVAQLKSDEFERLLASDALHPLATWDELTTALGRGIKKAEDHRGITLPLRFRLGTLPESRRREFVDRLIDLCFDFKVPWQPSKACAATIRALINRPPPVPNGTTKPHQRVGASAAM
jgi:hypothetical protein